MSRFDVHSGLESQLEALIKRIAVVKNRAEATTGFVRLQAHSEIQELERRLLRLETKLEILSHARPGIKRMLAAEMQFLVNDLQGNIEDFMRSVDSRSRTLRHLLSGK